MPAYDEIDFRVRIAKLNERKTPTADVPYEQAAALWYIGKQLERLADVMEEAHK